MQFKVPQDVLRPDKIVGFLTLRQLIIVAIGGGIAYSLYIVLSKQYFVEIWMPPVVVVSLITLAFAFFRFRDIPFEKFLLIFVEYKFRPRARYWQKMHGDVVLSVLDQPIGLRGKPKAQTSKQMTAQERKTKLEEITKIVDTHGGKIISKQKQ